MNYAYIAIFANVLEKIFRKISLGEIWTFLNFFPPLLSCCAEDQTKGMWMLGKRSATELDPPLPKQPS